MISSVSEISNRNIYVLEFGTLREIFKALLVCFIVCGLLATILIALHDWGKPVNQCDLAQETYQKSRLYNTVLRIKNHERSQVRSNARKLDWIIFTIRIIFRESMGAICYATSKSL